MAKRIAVINDLSGFGRCSLTAAISVIAAMGVSPCPLPTAVLSAQTGYPSYYCDDYTDKMEHFRSEWEKMKVSFDGIYTGFIASENQIQQIFRFLDTFQTQDNFLLVDPIMGDDGNTYDMFTPKLLSQMKELALKADIVTPNLTELCLLTDSDYHEISSIEGTEELFKIIQELSFSLLASGPEHVAVTGIPFYDHDIAQVGNFYATRHHTEIISFPHVGGSYSGTGDLFASCLAAGVVRGEDISSVIRKAGKFIELSMKDSVREKIPRNDGVNYEPYLSLLMPGVIQ